MRIVTGKSDTGNGRPIGNDTRDAIRPVTLDRLVTEHPRLREPVVDGIARRGEVVNIIGPSKVGKSWLAYGLGLCITTGREWLDAYRATQGRVLLIDNELHPELIAHRVPTVATAMRLPAEQYGDMVDVVSLRGRLLDYDALGAALIHRIKEREYRAIIVDAHYRMLPVGVSENENAQMARVYNTIDRFARGTDATWFLIHHASKGDQTGKAVTDVGAGAGSQSRAADTHLILRRHEIPGHVVLEAAVRSFKPVAPVTLRWDFPLWVPSHLDPAKLRGRLTRGDRRQREDNTEADAKILDVLREWDVERDGVATPNRITDRCPYGKERTRNALSRLVDEGKLGLPGFEWVVRGIYPRHTLRFLRHCRANECLETWGSARIKAAW